MLPPSADSAGRQCDAEQVGAPTGGAIDPYLVDVPRPVPGEHGLIVELPRYDWSEIFGRRRPLRVEVGVGKSDFLLQVARSEPDFNYVGFEYSIKRVRKFLKKVHRLGLENVRVVSRDVRHIFDRMFDPGSVDRFFILFPDPWPKRRHAKNRFVQDRNVKVLIEYLRPGGGLTLRTDDRPYAQQMLEVLDGWRELVNLAGRGCFAREPREPFKTLYQVRWEAEGREIYFLEYDKKE